MQPLQQSLPAVLADIIRRAPLSPEKVVFAWRVAVGPAIARISTVRLSEAGVIEVHCADDHWRREIRRSVPVIRARLMTLLGDDVIRQVKVPGTGARNNPRPSNKA
jgi:predicted nucleic acid-binding Zn ribbon protein